MAARPCARDRRQAGFGKGVRKLREGRRNADRHGIDGHPNKPSCVRFSNNVVGARPERVNAAGTESKRVEQGAMHDHNDPCDAIPVGRYCFPVLSRAAWPTEGPSRALTSHEWSLIPAAIDPETGLAHRWNVHSL